MAIKNIWSLSTDEAIVIDRIRQELGKGYEVFFPVNSQLKDIDLIIFNLKSGKAITVQVKGSRSYESNGDQYAWIVVKASSIFDTINKTDFFIFVWHVENHNQGKRNIEQAYIVIPLSQLKKKCKTEKVKRQTGYYHFNFWTDLKKYAYDYPTEKNAKKEIDFSKYLNNFKLLKT